MANNNINDQMSDLQKSAIDGILKFARISLDSAERLVALNMEVAKNSLDEAAKQIKSTASIRDLNEFTTARSKGIESAMEQAAGYSRSLYDLAASAQGEIGQLFENSLNQVHGNVLKKVEEASEYAPVGSEVAVAAAKTAANAFATVSDQINKAFKQASSFADASMKAANNVTSATVKAARSKASA